MAVRPATDPAAIAAHLVAAGVLTAFQAEWLTGGRGRDLVVGGRYRLGAGGMGEVYLADHAVMRHRWR